MSNWSSAPGPQEHSIKAGRGVSSVIELLEAGDGGAPLQRLSPDSLSAHGFRGPKLMNGMEFPADAATNSRASQRSPQLALQEPTGHCGFFLTDPRHTCRSGREPQSALEPVQGPGPRIPCKRSHVPFCSQRKSRCPVGYELSLWADYLWNPRVSLPFSRNLYLLPRPSRPLINNTCLKDLVVFTESVI